MRFSYSNNISRFLNEHGFRQQEQTIIEYIAGCFRQSEAYFSSSSKAPLDISPLLLYYGATNLLAGSVALLNNAIPKITEHGIMPTLQGVNLDRIANFRMKPKNRQTGALSIFADVFSDKCNLVNGEIWTLEEILGSIPDLKQDFEMCYPEAFYFTIPIQIIRKHDRTLERIVKAELARYVNPGDALSKVLEIEKAYLPYQNIDSYIILHPKMMAKPIGIYSIFGQKYLSIAHQKNGFLVSPSQLILMLMGMFALGYMSRYKPERWAPFVIEDKSGERLVVEKYLQLCQRYFPNLVLNVIGGERIQFSHELVGILDMTVKETD